MSNVIEPPQQAFSIGGWAGGTKVAIQRPLFFTGRERQKSEVRYWAERGLIHLSWFDDVANHERYDSMTIDSAVERVKALNDMVGRTPIADRAFYADEIKQLQDFIEQMVEIIRMAKEQGDPTSDQVAKEQARDRKSRVVVPPTVYHFDF